MKKSNKVIVLAEIHVLPGYEEIVLEAAEKVRSGTRAEKGNEAYILTTERENKGVIRFFEIFTDNAAFKEHAKAAHTAAFGEVLKGRVKNDTANLTFLQEYETRTEQDVHFQ